MSTSPELPNLTQPHTLRIPRSDNARRRFGRSLRLSPRSNGLPSLLEVWRLNVLKLRAWNLELLRGCPQPRHVIAQTAGQIRQHLSLPLNDQNRTSDFRPLPSGSWTHASNLLGQKKAKSANSEHLPWTPLPIRVAG